jgi:hypothetical protein
MWLQPLQTRKQPDLLCRVFRRLVQRQLGQDESMLVDLTIQAYAGSQTGGVQFWTNHVAGALAGHSFRGAPAQAQSSDWLPFSGQTVRLSTQLPDSIVICKVTQVQNGFVGYAASAQHSDRWVNLRFVQEISPQRERYHWRSTVRGRPAVESPASVSDSTTPYVFREVATFGQRTEEGGPTTRLCWDNRRLLAIAQGHVHDVRGEHASIREAHARDIAPSKRLIPLWFKVRKHTDADLGIIKLHGEHFSERLPGA